MKLFLLIVLIAMVYAKAPSGPDCSNPFLESLKKEGVAIGVQPSTTKCPGEWKAFGSCCNETQLQKLYLREAMEVKNSSAQLSSLVAQIEEILVKAKSTCEGFSIFGKSVSPELKREYTQAIDTFLNESLFRTFNHSSEVCWNKMNKVRGSALCSICSGRGNTFFNSSKVLVGLDDCEGVLDSCKNFFLDITSFFRGFSAYVFSLERLEKSKEVENFRMLNSTIMGLSLPLDLQKEFSIYENSKDRFEIDQAAGIICNRILKIRQTPYVEKVKVAINQVSLLGALVTLKVTKVFTQVATHVVSKFIPFKNQKLFSNWEPRSLQSQNQFGQTSAGTFESDSQTFYKNSDNMFTADNQNSDYNQRPMNMSHMFP